MYCTTCGHELHSTANYCRSCGSNVSLEKTRVAQREPRSRSGSSVVLELRPTFVPQLAMLSVLPLQVFFTIWGAMFFGGFSMFALDMLGVELPKGSTFVFWGVIFFLGVPLLAYLSRSKTYQKTRYNFYPHKLDYHEGFFTTEEKTINYDNVTEVYLRKGVFQKMFGLGTIVLSTPATSIAAGRVRAGIMISDIPNPDRVYQQVKDIIKRF